MRLWLRDRLTFCSLDLSMLSVYVHMKGATGSDTSGLYSVVERREIINATVPLMREWKEIHCEEVQDFIDKAGEACIAHAKFATGRLKIDPGIPTRDTRNAPNVTLQTRIISVGVGEPSSTSRTASPSLGGVGWMVSDFYMWLHGRLGLSMGICLNPEKLYSTRVNCSTSGKGDNRTKRSSPARLFPAATEEHNI